MDIAGSMNITFRADISHLVAHRPSVLYWVIQPGSNVGGIGAGLVRMVRPWNEWLVVWGYDINGSRPRGGRGAAHADRPQPARRPDLDVEIIGHSLWGNNEMYADAPAIGPGLLRRRRDPPAPAEQRPRLEHLDPGLLQPGLEARRSPSWAGRAGAAGHVSTRSARRWLGRSCCGPTSPAANSCQFFDVLGVTAAETEAEMIDSINERKLNTPAGAIKRAALLEAMELKNYEFNAHGVELGQFYESTAVVPDGTPRARADPDPGAVLPAVHRAGLAIPACLGGRQPGTALAPTTWRR